MATGARPSDTASVYAVAADAGQMRDVLANHLRTVDGLPVEVRACEVLFARHGDARSLFQYRLEIVDPLDGRPRAQDVTALAYGGGRTRGVWDRLRKRLPVHARSASGLVPVFHVPDPELLVQVFPFDHQMPALAALLDGPWPALADRLLAAFGPGDWRIVEWDTEVVRYRVDMRATVRLTVGARRSVAGRPARRTFYAKAYANPTQAIRSWKGQQDLAAALAASGSPLAIAPMVAWLPEDRVLIQQEVRGDSLSNSINDRASAEAALRRAARALAVLHQLPIAAPPPARELARSGPERLERDAARLRQTRPDLAERVDAIVAELSAWMATDDNPGVPVHGDLKPDHVLLDGRRVVLLDFDKFEAGDPILDVNNLARGIELRRRDSPGNGGRGTATAFVDEYFAHVPPAWRERKAPHHAALLLMDASKQGRRVGERKRRGDRDHVMDLVAEVEGILGIAPGPHEQRSTTLEARRAARPNAA